MLPRLRRTLGRLPVVPKDVADDSRAIRLVDDQTVYTVAGGAVVAHLKAAKLRVRSGPSIAPVVSQGDKLVSIHQIVVVPGHVDAGAVDDSRLLLGAVVGDGAGIVLAGGVVAALVVERDEILGVESSISRKCTLISNSVWFKPRLAILQ